MILGTLRTAAVAAGSTCLAFAALLVGAAPAAAATCNAPVRYASTSDTIYLTGGTAVDTLTEIKAACPSAPLTQVSPGVWDLNADLVLQTGAKLTLDRAGDVQTLRLQSLPSGLATDVSAITAQYGQIDITGVTVTSWTGTGPGHRLRGPGRRCPRPRVHPRAVGAWRAARRGSRR